MRYVLLPRSFGWFRCVALAALWVASAHNALAQFPSIYRVEEIPDDDRRLEMVADTTRVLELSSKIKRVQVTDENLLELVPLETPNQIQLIAKSPGITVVNLWDEEDQLFTVNVTIDADARQLNRQLERLYPDSAVRAIPVRGSVIIRGYVNSPEEAEGITQIAGLFYPDGNVIDNVVVGGERQVQLKVKIMEVQRTKLRALGVNWRYFGNGGSITGDFASSVGELLTETADSTDFLPGETQLTFGLLSQNEAFVGIIEALRRENLLKILAEPNVVAISGRPASFLIGGEFPFQVSQAFGQPPAIEFKPFGTRLDFVPLVLGNGRIRLEVRPEISEIRQSQDGSSTVPALQLRRVETAVELAAGETLVIAGLISTRETSTTQKVPIVGELPGPLGAAFRRVRNETEEVEMVVMVTPELVSGMAPDEVPPFGPGDESDTPNDPELFLRGLLEVPAAQTQHVVRRPGVGTAMVRPSARPALQAQRSPSRVRGSQVGTAARWQSQRPTSGTRRSPRSAATASSGGRLRLIGPHGYDTGP